MIDLDAPGPPEARPPRRRRRPWGLLLAATLVLPLHGAGPPAPPGPVLVLGGEQIRDLRVGDGTIYVLTRRAATAFRMPDGAPRWSVPLEPGGQLLAAADGRVVLAIEESATSTAALVGLDAAGGTQVWRRDGYVPSIYGAAGAPDVVVARPDPAGGDPQPDQRLAGIDIRTGAIRWALGPSDGLRTLLFAGDGPGLAIAELDPGGTLRIRDAESGAVVRTATLPDLVPVDGFDVSGDRLLAYRSGRGTLLQSAVYDLDTGRLLWQRTDEPTGVALWWCGRLLCTGTLGSTAVLDPDTGRELWRLTGWTDLGPLDDGHLWTTRPNPDATDPALGGIVLDADTGRIVHRIGAWDVVGALPDQAVLVAGRGAGGSLVARLDLRTWTVTVLGRAGHWDAPPQCLATATLLVCRADKVSVWPR